MATFSRDDVAKIAVACVHFNAWTAEYPIAVGKKIKKDSANAAAIIQRDVVQKARVDLPAAIVADAKRDGLPQGTRFVDIDWLAIVIDEGARFTHLSGRGANAKIASDWLKAELAKVDAKFASL